MYVLEPGLGHRNEPTFMEDGGVVRVVAVVVVVVWLVVVVKMCRNVMWGHPGCSTAALQQDAMQYLCGRVTIIYCSSLLPPLSDTESAHNAPLH